MSSGGVCLLRIWTPAPGVSQSESSNILHMRACISSRTPTSDHPPTLQCALPFPATHGQSRERVRRRGRREAPGAQGRYHRLECILGQQCQVCQARTVRRHGLVKSAYKARNSSRAKSLPPWRAMLRICLSNRGSGQPGFLVLGRALMFLLTTVTILILSQDSVQTFTTKH